MSDSVHGKCNWPKCQTTSVTRCNGVCSAATTAGGPTYRQIMPSPPEPTPDAATALTEAQATIARQQEMLDRALESNGDMQVTIARMEAALQRIADWNLPPSGLFYPNADGSESDRPAPYDSVYGWGSEGGKKAVREIARAALSSPDTPG